MRRLTFVSLAALVVLAGLAFPSTRVLAQGQAVELVALGESFSPGTSVNAVLLVENRLTTPVTYCSLVRGVEGCEWFITLRDPLGNIVYQTPGIACLTALGFFPLEPYESLRRPVSAPLPAGSPPGIYSLEVLTAYSLTDPFGNCAVGLGNTTMARIPIDVR